MRFQEDRIVNLLSDEYLKFVHYLRRFSHRCLQILHFYRNTITYRYLGYVMFGNYRLVCGIHCGWNFLFPLLF